MLLYRSYISTVDQNMITHSTRLLMYGIHDIGEPPVLGRREHFSRGIRKMSGLSTREKFCGSGGMDDTVPETLFLEGLLDQATNLA